MKTVIKEQRYQKKAQITFHVLLIHLSEDVGKLNGDTLITKY